jgi:hypothetical protein
MGASQTRSRLCVCPELTTDIAEKQHTEFQIYKEMRKLAEVRRLLQNVKSDGATDERLLVAAPLRAPRPAARLASFAFRLSLFARSARAPTRDASMTFSLSPAGDCSEVERACVFDRVLPSHQSSEGRSNVVGGGRSFEFYGGPAGRRPRSRRKPCTDFGFTAFGGMRPVVWVTGS